VRMVEEAVRDRGGSVEDAPTATTQLPAGPSVGGAGSTRLRPPGLLELEELLADHLSTRVRVTMSGKRGKVLIEFADLEDLERIYHRMTTQSEEVV